MAPILLATVLATVGCEVETSRTPTAERSPKRPHLRSGSPSNPASPTPTETTESSSADPANDYAPNAVIPSKPSPLAKALTKVHADLDADVQAWLRDGGPLHGPQVRRIERAALFQQRVYRKMTRSPELGRAALRLLDRGLRREARANFTAGVGLSAGLMPVEPPIRLDTTEPESPHRLRSFYEQAERRFGVDRAILAGVNFVETRFGRILGPSSAGALGPMQFLPSTWEQYGNDGDIMDPHDAIIGAARYLRASGGVTRPRDALFAYNRSDAYVEAVMAYARQMQRKPSTFFEYYFWQVFVRTTKGDMQLTGPGADKP
ncbi:MAG: lytic transglycosylase domain-containing protein [Actinomycetota bacterium]|nr:lytic transglycosylase domain-containing protein [Actinomycetota bacterium]